MKSHAIRLVFIIVSVISILGLVTSGCVTTTAPPKPAQPPQSQPPADSPIPIPTPQPPSTTVPPGVEAVTIALTVDDVKAKVWIFDSTKVPNADSTTSTYSITFRKGDELLTNSIFIYPTSALAEQRYFIDQLKYRLSSQNIYSIGEIKAYVITDPGLTPDKPERFGIRFVKGNTCVELGFISNYTELETYARLLAARVHL
jgi:hypothetical protein